MAQPLASQGNSFAPFLMKTNLLGSTKTNKDCLFLNPNPHWILTRVSNFKSESESHKFFELESKQKLNFKSESQKFFELKSKTEYQISNPNRILFLFTFVQIPIDLWTPLALAEKIAI